jgi:hypothetical protein
VVGWIAVALAAMLLVYEHWFGLPLGSETSDPARALARLGARVRAEIGLVAALIFAVALVSTRQGLLILRSRSYPPEGARLAWTGRPRSAGVARLIAVGHLLATLLLLALAAGLARFAYVWAPAF